MEENSRIAENIAKIFLDKQLIEKEKIIHRLMTAIIILSILLSALLGGIGYIIYTQGFETGEVLTQETQGEQANIINDGQYNDNATRNG